MLKKKNFSDLVRIMDRLRDPGGCPWDGEQTHESIRRNFLEEAYEAVDAIDRRDSAHLCEELGDVLLQVVFHARIARDAGTFTLDDVIDGICRKLIYRHPHIFGDAVVSGTEQVLENWDELKKREKGHETFSQAMEEVARSLPALIYAEKVQKRAAKAGFDWDDARGAIDKLREETDELQAAIASGQGVEEELGDLLFAAVNVSRFAAVDAENALTLATRKFMRRFEYVEQAAGQALSAMSLPEMDKLWEQAKAAERPADAPRDADA